MKSQDIDQVTGIEKEAFYPLTIGTSFTIQLRNKYSRYLVIETRPESAMSAQLSMVAGLFGGVTTATATMRTVANIKFGGKTPLASIVHGLTLLAILLGLGFLVAAIPTACLAAILFKVGIDILDYRILPVLKKIPWTDLSRITKILPDIKFLTAEIINNILMMSEHFRVFSFDDFQLDWKRHDMLKGKQVKYADLDDSFEGEVVGVSSQGALIILTKNGVKEIYSSKYIEYI